DPATIERDSFRSELGVSPETPLVGLIAHFYPPMHGLQAPLSTRGVGLKGQETFLAAARIVVRRFPDARFVLVGAGFHARGERYRLRLIEICRVDGFLDKVLFTGYRSDLPRVLGSFDVAVQCPLTEGLGGSIEALLMERPTVVTNIGGLPEAV